MASYVIFHFKASKERHRINFDGPGITVFELKREIVKLFGLGPGKDSDLFIYDAGTDEEYTDDNAVIPKTYEVVGKRRPAARPGHGTTARYASAHAAPKPRRPNNAVAASAKPSSTADYFAAMDHAKTEEEKIQALMHGEDALWSEKKKELSLAQAVPFRGQPQPGENDKTPPGYICHRCNLPGHFKKFCPTLNDPNFVPKPRPVKTTGIPTTMLEVINDPEGSDSDQASKAYMINRSGNRVRVKIDNAFWEKEQAIKRTSAKRRADDDESENDEDDSDEEKVSGARSKARKQSPNESNVKPDPDAKQGVGSESKESHAHSPKGDSEVTPNADADAEVNPPAKRPRLESPADGATVDAKEDTDAESKKTAAAKKKASPKGKPAEPAPTAPTAPAAMRKQLERERLVKQGLNPQFLDDMEKLSQGLQMPDANMAGAMNPAMMAAMNPAGMAAMNGMNMNGMNGMFFHGAFPAGFPNAFSGGFGWPGMQGMAPMPMMPNIAAQQQAWQGQQQQRPPTGPQGQQQQQGQFQQRRNQQQYQQNQQQGKQFGGAAGGGQGNEEQSPYFRQPVNPHRHTRQKHLRPSEYTELGNR